MPFWENFEYYNQMLLAPLLANTKQKDLFLKTNSNHERMFIDFVARLIKPSHFFEIGAHEASACMKIARMLPDTSCTGFEADPDVYFKFADIINRLSNKLPNVSYVHSIISDIDGELTFFKQDGPDVYLPNNSILTKPLPIKYNERKIKSQRLDTVASHIKPEDRVVMKIDVEGVCYEVLSGAPKALQSTVAIYAEVEDYEIWNSQKTVFDIYPILEDMGFVPVSRDVQTPGQYNVLWLRRDMALERRFRSRLALYYSELMSTIQEAMAKRDPNK